MKKDKIKHIINSPNFQKGCVVIGLIIISLVYIYITTQPQRAEKVGNIMNGEEVFVFTGTNSANSKSSSSEINYISKKTDNNKNYATINKEDDLDITFDKLYENNKKVINSLLLNPLKHSQDNILAPYYVVETKDYSYSDIEKILLDTYTKEYVYGTILSQENPFYFESDGVFYYNETNNLTNLKNVNLDNAEKELVEKNENQAKYKIKIINDSEEINLTAIVINTENGWRLKNILN